MPDHAPIPNIADPFNLFATWFKEAQDTEPNDANAMTLATSTRDGFPSARIVLLKEWDADGFVFYTNKDSRKGDELAANPCAALLFHWKSLHRQVRVEGAVSHMPDAAADAYYATRARVSRLGAWASAQSRPLATRAVLEARLKEFEARYPGDAIPRPPHWGGYRITPGKMEFWQDMPFRLHDRSVYTKGASEWTLGKIFP